MTETFAVALVGETETVWFAGATSVEKAINIPTPLSPCP